MSVVLALGACSHYSSDLSSLENSMKGTQMASNAAPQDIEPAAGHSPINTYLAQDYYELARYENDKSFDYKAARDYTNKAMLASKGAATQPSRLSSYDIPASMVPELTQARRDLMTALKEQNLPENQQYLAKAQTSFDCWLERAEEAADEKHYAQCKSDFEQAMALLVMPAAGVATTSYDIPFAPNTAVIDPAAGKTIEYIAQTLNTPGNEGYNAHIQGVNAPDQFADSSTAAKTKAVHDALVAKGVAPGRLTTSIETPAAMYAGAVGKVIVSLVTPAASAGGSTTTTTTFVPVAPQPVQ